MLTVFSNESNDALPHLAGSLISERERKNLIRLDAAVNKIGNSIGKHPRLAAASTGDNHYGTVQRLDGFLLHRI